MREEKIGLKKIQGDKNQTLGFVPVGDQRPETGGVNIKVVAVSKDVAESAQLIHDFAGFGRKNGRANLRDLQKHFIEEFFVPAGRFRDVIFVRA